MADTPPSGLADGIFETCTPERAAEQIARFGDHRVARVYVERRDNAYRWSIAHRGGAYPLLRELARFLDVPYGSIILPFGTVDGWAIVLAPDLAGEPDAWGIIEPSNDVSTNLERLLEATGVGERHGPERSTPRRPLDPADGADFVAAMPYVFKAAPYTWAEVSDIPPRPDPDPEAATFSKDT